MKGMLELNDDLGYPGVAAYYTLLGVDHLLGFGRPETSLSSLGQDRRSIRGGFSDLVL
jgi:hypothetical protein